MRIGRSIGLKRVTVKGDFKRVPSHLSSLQNESTTLSPVDSLKSERNLENITNSNPEVKSKPQIKSKGAESLEEFRRYAPILVIFRSEKYMPLKMNFDGEWKLANNALNYKKRFSELSEQEFIEQFKQNAVAYVHKLENVKVDGKTYTVYQYWFYWPYNSFLFDWHDHDLEYVQVYVNSQGQIERVYTSYHLWVFESSRSEYLKPLPGMMRAPNVKWFKVKGEPSDEKLTTLVKSAHTEPLVVNDHPVVFVEPGSHGMVMRRSKSLLLNFKKIWFAFRVKRFIPMISSSENDAPFPNGQDVHKLIDKSGNLKHRGFPYNWFIRVKSPLLRRSFWEGAHVLNHRPSTGRRDNCFHEEKLY